MACNWQEAQVKDGSAHSVVRVLEGGKNTSGHAGIPVSARVAKSVLEPSPSVQLRGSGDQRDRVLERLARRRGPQG